MNKIIIVGAGPAGIMAAIRASESGSKVILVEKNPSLARKLLLSGKGRCNLTNACDIEDFLKRSSKNGESLRDAFKHFFYKDLMHFFEQRGVKLNIERQQRVFPDSGDAKDIVRVLEAELKKDGVEIIYNATFKDIRTISNKITAPAAVTTLRKALDNLVGTAGSIIAPPDEEAVDGPLPEMPGVAAPFDDPLPPE